MKINSFVTALLVSAALVIGTACTDRSQSGDKTTGTGTNSPTDSSFSETAAEQVRFEGKNTQAMPAVSDQPTDDFVVTEELVRQVQSALKAKGHDINVNGIESSETSRAVERFQSESGLSPTGRIDQALVTKLGIKSSDDRTPSSVPSQKSPTGN